MTSPIPTETGRRTGARHRVDNFRVLTAVLITGISVWVTILVVNNITDMQTNGRLIGATISMAGVKDEPDMGNGLEWRAVSTDFAPALLIAAIAFQCVLCFLWWRAAVSALKSVFDRASVSTVVSRANLALAGWLAMFLGFLTIGLYFGYWIGALAPIQTVHIILLGTGIMIAALINLAPLAERLREPEPTR